MSLAEKQKIKLNEQHRGFLQMASYKLKSEHKVRGKVVADAEKVDSLFDDSQTLLRNAQCQHMFLPYPNSSGDKNT